MSTIFTSIINKEIPAEILYEDDALIVFLSIAPISEGHCLVVPKREVDHLDELSAAEYSQIMEKVQSISKLLKRILQPKRIGLMVVGEEVPHAHVHVVPLYTLQELNLKQTPVVVDSSIIAPIAAKIRVAQSN